MLKRTNSYLLLTLLVLTGFAGSINNQSLTVKERKVLVKDLKETRKAFFQSFKGLSDAQLNYRPHDSAWTIQECIYHLALSEKNLWDMANNLIRQPVNPEKRKNITISDEERMTMMRDRSTKRKARENFNPKTSPYTSKDQAIEDFRERRIHLIKFVKTTTDDLRSHIMEGPMGAMDAYQVLLLLSAHTARHTAQIEEIKQSAGFPR